MNLLVTGGCGFIGSNLIRRLLVHSPIHKLVNLDCLTYAGHPANVRGVDSPCVPVASAMARAYSATAFDESSLPGIT